MLERFDSALESVKEATMLDWLVATGLAATSLMIANQGVSFYQSLFGGRKMNKLDLIAIASERESALSQYRESLADINSDSLGSALLTVNTAMTDFKRTLSRNPDAIELGNNKKLLAKLHYMRAQIYSLQDEALLAEKELLTAVMYHPGFILAHNLLAHLYLYPLHNQDKAKKSLQTSLSLNRHQVYTSFYLAMLNNDLPAMNAAAEKILHVYYQQFEANRLDKLRDEHPALTTLLATTPFATIPYILVNWLDVKLEKERNPQALLSIVNAFNAILNEVSAISNTKLRVMMQECRISALLKLSKMKVMADEFNVDEAALRDHCGLSTVEGDANSYYFEYAGEHLDKAVSGLFARGTETEYLKDPKYHERVAEIIIGWAKHGLLNGDSKIIISELISPQSVSKELVSYFIDTYVKGMGWKPWLTVVPDREQMHSLLSLSCEEQGVQLLIYSRDQEHNKNIVKDPLASVANAKSVLRVLYDPECSSVNSFKLLAPLSAPADLYLWMALTECWVLLKKDDAVNAYALSVLGERGLAVLPQYALAKLSDDHLPKTAKAAVLAGLNAYIEHHDGACQADKEYAITVRDNYTAANTKASFSRFFPKKVVLGVAATAAATLGLAYLLRRE